MLPALVALALAAVPPATAPIHMSGAPPVEVQPLAGPADVAALCRRLVPPERLRTGGDAVVQGEARTRQQDGRERAILGRYAMTVPGARLAFAPYDGPEQRLEVAEPAVVRLEGVTLVAAQDRSLPVHVDAGTARRVLEAQRAGRLDLQLVFDLPDEAVCTTDPRWRRVSLEIEPVEWRWLEGEVALARGGVAADLPALSVAVGAQPTVDVGEPIAGPSSARRAVAARRADLARCYAEELRRDPGVDGVLVVDLGARVAVSADSTGAPGLGGCVERALASVAVAAPASVPIRFELALPGSAAARAAAAVDSAPVPAGPELQ